MVGREGGGEVEAGEDWRPSGVVGGGEGISGPKRETGRAEDQKGVWPGFPRPLGPQGAC